MKKKELFPRLLLLCLTLAISLNTLATDKKDKKQQTEYQFTSTLTIPTTTVKDQASTGTCWSFATTSFIETELIRMGKGSHDLSEMFFVRMVYPEKAKKYIRYQGNANFGEGGQAHDVMNTIAAYGLVPESAYSGINYGLKYHKHGELTEILQAILDGSLKHMNGFSGKAFEVFNAALDIYLGRVPEKFDYNGKEYTPQSFLSELEFKSSDYVEFTSYQSYPFYSWVDLEIPDNWSHDKYFNLPIDELMTVIDYAFDQGFSVNWDGDVSEAGFSHNHGIAIVPETDPANMDNSERLKWDVLSQEEKAELLFDFSKPRKEKAITQELRQKAFDQFLTTDDHLMHLVGKATDQNGTGYYLTKNSWANDSNKMGGYLYMSNSYLRLKTIAIQIHKDAIPEAVKERLKAAGTF
ncbi:MAG: aminopeptidase [Bacteroidetes bacterium HGW-Bacteroidetes-4]|jgi:bleomycin hydrolase|nr:MAG: aminopeptidase [Bacteroidetes bacterium HGW-Bacteroidetes-4]